MNRSLDVYCGGRHGGHAGPTALRALFRLKYQEGIKDPEQLASRLQVGMRTLYEYDYRLRRRLSGQGVRLSVEQGSTLDQVSSVCPECLLSRLPDGSLAVWTDPEGERVCRNCGFVIERIDGFDGRLPFNTTFALESMAATDKSLGSVPSVRECYKIIAKVPKSQRVGAISEVLGSPKAGPNGSDVAAADFPLRAKQVRIMSNVTEHPFLADLLRMLVDLSKRYNLEGDVIFNNSAAVSLRRTFWLTQAVDKNYTKRTVVESVFWYTVCQFGKKTLGAKLKDELKVDPTLLNLTLEINSLVENLNERPLESFILMAPK